MGAILKADCVIVGGGIGGAVLALLLGQRGHQVILLERELTPPRIGRPEVLARSTIALFERLGAGTRILQEAALPLHGLEVYRAGGRRLLMLSQDDFDRAGAQPYSTDPIRTRELLLEQAQTIASVEVRRGVEVQELLREDSRVIGVRARRGDESFTVQARLVIGDDGGHSRIRSGLGIPLTLRAFPLDFVCAAGPRLPGGSAFVGQAWIDPSAIRRGIAGGIFMPIHGSRTALVFLVSPSAYERFRQSPASVFYEAAARLSPRCSDLVAASFRFPEGFAHLRRPFGHAPRYVADGAALLGDAAHPVTPAGGQGGNMSVADAEVLAEVLHEALTHGDCSASRLKRYETDRWPSNQRSIQFSVRTDTTLRLLGALPFLTPLLPWLLTRVDRSPQMKARFIRAVSQTFTTRWREHA